MTDAMRDDRALLTEVALLGALSGLPAEARVIAAALPAGSRERAVAEGMAALAEGRPDDAASSLRPRAEAGDADAAALLVLALRMGGRAGEADAARRLVPDGAGPASDLARAL